MPIHFGGMSDPFQPIEKEMKISLKVLKYLCEIKYPIVISTRSDLLAENNYLSILKSNPFVVIQFSFSSSKDEISNISEPFAIKPSKVFKTIEKLSTEGIKTTVRWQPYIPNVSESPADFISSISSLGIKHLALEHLKLPVERDSDLWLRLSKKLDFDIYKYYQSKKSSLDGREFILPPDYKLRRAMEVKMEVNRRNITFGAADNEIQYLSDNDCCCSGVDQFEGFENWNKFQIGYAVKRSNFQEITFDSIRSEWFPVGAIDKHLNSKSRIPKCSENHNGFLDYVKNRWQNLDSNFNPSQFYNVEYSGREDKNNMKIYTWKKKELLIS